MGCRKKTFIDLKLIFCDLFFRKFILKYSLPIPEDVREKIGDIVKSSECLYPPVTLYDSVQAQIENLLLTTTYPSFLKSDMYLQYVEVKIGAYCIGKQHFNVSAVSESAKFEDQRPSERVKHRLFESSQQS